MLKKFRYILYAILFVSTISINAIGGVFALFNANIDSTVGVNYEAETEPVEETASLIEGQKFGEYLIMEKEGIFGLTYEEVIFDYATPENLELVQNATKCVSVAEDGSDDILLYEVGSAVYILSSKKILANEDCYSMFNFTYVGGGMIENCISNIEFNNFDTRNLVDMSSMFECFYGIDMLDLSGWNTSNLECADNVFCESGFSVVNLSGWNTNKLESMSGMFAYSETKVIDLSGWDTSCVQYMNNLFGYATNLETVYVSDSWTTAGLILEYDYDLLFMENTSLVGGNGTVFDPAHVDYTYARIDTPETPGYFTLKQ